MKNRREFLKMLGAAVATALIWRQLDAAYEEPLDTGWHHYAMYFTAAPHYVYIYVDGKLVDVWKEWPQPSLWERLRRRLHAR